MAADVQGLGQVLPRSLTDILESPYKHRPIQFAKSSKTTDVFASNSKNKGEALAAVNPKLTHIIPCHTLIQQLESEFREALEGIWIEPGDRLSMRVDPKYTTISLPRAIHSEKDSEDVFLGLFLHPALSLLGFLTAKEKLERDHLLMEYTVNDIMEHKEQEAFDFRFYAASFGGANNIADIGVYKLRSNNKANLHLAIEIKTPEAFPEQLLSSVSPRILASPFYYDGIFMTEEDMKNIDGWAIEFKWPKKGQNFGHSPTMKHNKVISQVWNQMVAHKQRFALLSCNDVHYCVYRKDTQSGHLYISPPCYPTDRLKNVLIWTLKAAGYIKGDIEVPSVRDDWWKEVEESGSEASSDEKILKPGINMKTVPLQAFKVYKKRESRTKK